MRSSAAASARATASQIYCPSTNCWKTPTINCLINAVITSNTHSTIFYHHLTWHHNITISVSPHITTDNYLHAPDTWLMQGFYGKAIEMWGPNPNRNPNYGGPGWLWDCGYGGPWLWRPLAMAGRHQICTLSKTNAYLHAC